MAEESAVVEGDNSEYFYDDDDGCDSDEVDAILEDFCGKSVSGRSCCCCSDRCCGYLCQLLSSFSFEIFFEVTVVV